MNIWRLNVRETQIGECIRSKKYALSSKRKNPEILQGDVLLLQLVANDSIKLGKEKSRIEFALIFDHYQEDYDGSISTYYWPNARKIWRWILHCSEIIITVPFSLENLQLQKDYAGQTNPIKISDEDVDKIQSYLLNYYKIKEIGSGIRDALNQIPASRENTIWSMIQNNDRIVEESPDQIEWTIVPRQKKIKSNPELPCLLKELYKFKCQVCGHDFKPQYNIPYAETHHVIWISRGGIDHSNNLIVICPNHHRIIHEAQPKFDRKELAFIYPNGYRESFQLATHIKDYFLLQKIEQWCFERAKQINKEKDFTNNIE